MKKHRNGPMGAKKQLPPKIKNPTPNQLVGINAHIDIDIELELEIEIEIYLPVIL